MLTDLRPVPFRDKAAELQFCMRIILSQGKVNIFNLAKNAGTSVNQIENFYARNLPLSPELQKSAKF